MLSHRGTLHLGYGRTSAKNGEVFNWVFNYPVNYWDSASIAIKYLKDQMPGLLKARKLPLCITIQVTAKNPLPHWKILSELHGFELKLLAVDHPGQEQKGSFKFRVG